MADRLISLLNSRIALVLTPDGVGTGSFIAKDIVLTCAHVVRSAVESEQEVLVRCGRDEVSKQPIHEFSSEVIFMSDKVGDKEYPDIALLKISGADRPFLKMASSQVPFPYDINPEYLAIGFQKRDRHSGRDIAQSVSLQYEGEEDATVHRKIEFENGLVRPGMSGAPLIERRTGVMTGIIQMTRSPNDDLGAYVIPIDVIWQTLQSKLPQFYRYLHTKQHLTSLRRQYRREYTPYLRLKAYGVRLLVLPAILFGGLFWFFYHLGPLQSSGALATLLLVLSLVGALFGRWMGREVASETNTMQKVLGNFVLHPATLSLTGGAIIALWLFTSSVWVYGGPSNANTDISIENSSQIRTRKFNEQGQVQFLVASTLFGDSIAITPKNREAKMSFIRSLSKQKLFYPRDFQLEPILLLRMDPNYPWLNKYQIEIVMDRDGEIYLDSTMHHEGSLLLGNRKFSISEERQMEWLKEIEEGVEIGIPEIERWKEIHARPDIDLDIGDRLTVTMTKKSNGKLVNEQSYSIRDDVTDRLFKMFQADN